MRNRFPGNCLVCGKRVDAGAGYFQKWPDRGRLQKWLVRCRECVGHGNESQNAVELSATKEGA